MAGALLKGGKLFRTNVTGEERNIEVLMFFFDVTSQTTVAVMFFAANLAC